MLGSQIFNILLIIGITSYISPISYSLSYNNDLCLLIFGTLMIAIYPFIGEKNKMTRMNGLLFVLIYAIYIFSVLKI